METSSQVAVWIEKGKNRFTTQLKGEQERKGVVRNILTGHFSQSGFFIDFGKKRHGGM